MTTLQQIDLRCPICDTRFRSQAVVSTNSFGGKRTDFHERAAGTQPLPYLIHMCARCGYSGSERDFSEEAEVSPLLKEHVWNELAPALATGAVSGSEKYEAAAKVSEWQGMEPRYVADLPCVPHGAAWTKATARPSASSGARLPGCSSRRSPATMAWRARSARC